MSPLSVIVIALWSATSGATASPAPAASASGNPFTLAPLPGATPLPQRIGTTRTRGFCTTLRTVIAPAIAAAIATDRQFGSLRKDVGEYTLSYKGNESGELKLVQMDAKVQSMVKSTDRLERILNDGNAFSLPRGASAEDQARTARIRSAMRGVLSAQKVELDAMSGFVETERMRRFGSATESEKQIQSATGNTARNARTGSLKQGGETSDVGGRTETAGPFLRDTNVVFHPGQSKISINDAKLLDDDLGRIADYVNRKGDVASQAIVPATELCK